MKKAELQAALAEGTPVAVNNSTADWAQEGAEQAYVLALGQKRKVYSGERYDFTGHWAHDGVLIRWSVDAKPLGITERAGQEEVVGPRYVLRPWAEHVEMMRARRDREQEKRDRREQRRQECAELAEALGGSVYLSGADHSPRGVVLTPEAARALAERLA